MADHRKHTATPYSDPARSPHRNAACSQQPRCRHTTPVYCDRTLDTAVASIAPAANTSKRMVVVEPCTWGGHPWALTWRVGFARTNESRYRIRQFPNTVTVARVL